MSNCSQCKNKPDCRFVTEGEFQPRCNFFIPVNVGTRGHIDHGKPMTTNKTESAIERGKEAVQTLTPGLVGHDLVKEDFRVMALRKACLNLITELEENEEVISHFDFDQQQAIQEDFVKVSEERDELKAEIDRLTALVQNLTDERDGLFGFVQNVYKAHPNIADDIAALPSEQE